MGPVHPVPPHCPQCCAVPVAVELVAVDVVVVVAVVSILVVVVLPPPAPKVTV